MTSLEFFRSRFRPRVFDLQLHHAGGPPRPAALLNVAYFSVARFPAASSLSRAICVQVRRRTGVMAAGPRRRSSSSDTGGNPAVPRSEFTSARFSARSRSTSRSSSRTYRLRACRDSHVIRDCHIGKRFWRTNLSFLQRTEGHHRRGGRCPRTVGARHAVPVFLHFAGRQRI